MKITVSHKTTWGARAAFDASRFIDAQLEDVEILAWGVDVSDQYLWLNINSGDVNFDIAITRECFSYGFLRQGISREDGFYRTNKPTLISYIKRGKPAVFSQNGAGRYLYSIDLEDPAMADIRYTDAGPIPDFSAESQAEAAQLEHLEKEWSATEKARQATMKAATAKAK